MAREPVALSRRPVTWFAVAALSVALGVATSLWGWLALAGIAALLAVIAAVRWPFLTTVALILYIPLEGFLLKWLGGASGVVSVAPEVLLALSAFSVLAVRGRRGWDTVAVGRWLAWIAVFALAGVVSGYLAGVPLDRGAYWVRTMVRYMPAAIAIAGSTGRREWRRVVGPALSFAVVVQAVIAVAEFVGGVGVRVFFSPGLVAFGGLQAAVAFADVAQGVSGTLGFYNNLALFAAMGYAVSMGGLRALSAAEGADAPRLQIAILRAGVIASVVCVMLAGSRQGIIIFLLLLGVMAAILGLRGVGGSGAISWIAGAGLVVIALQSPEVAGPLAWIPQRFGRIFNMSDVSQSMQTDRLFAFMRIAPSALAQRPLLGFGPGSTYLGTGVAVVAGALSLNSDAVWFVQDVGWVALLVQLGIVGFALILGLFVWMWARALEGRRAAALLDGETATVIGCLVVVMLGMFASSLLLVRSTSLVLWVVAGLCLRALHDSASTPAEA